MKNLKKFNVSELNNEELVSKGGGWTLLGPWRIFAILGGGKSDIEQIDQTVADLELYA